MSSTDIATIFLDRQMHIKRFTPAVQELFNIIPTDLGRPLSDLTGKLKYPDLPTDAQRVVRTLEKMEREVRADGHWFLARLSPYRTVDEKIDGLVVSFVDITQLKNAEDKLLANNDELMRFNKAAVGRETRMIEMKKEINELLAKLNLPRRYDLHFEKDERPGT